MPKFGVMCYDRGIWDNKGHKTVEAENELQAAMQGCGGKLVEGGKPGQLRAVVWPVSKPSDKTPFYIREA